MPLEPTLFSRQTPPTTHSPPRQVELQLETLEERLVLAANPLGAELLVNSFITNNQSAPAVATSAIAGTSVVAWVSTGQDGSGDGVYAQRYDKFGAAVGSAFRVNVGTSGNQNNVAVAMDAYGNFVVVWQSSDGSGDGIYARRYNLSGASLTSEFRVNSATSGNQQSPAVVMRDDGSFVVAWHSANIDGSGDAIMARRYSATGTALAAQFRVSQFSTGNQQFASIAVDSTGNFLIAWHSAGQDGAGDAVVARAFNASGSALGNELIVNELTAGDQRSPAVAGLWEGGFVVAWQGSAQDGSGEAIRARILTSNGAILGSELAVNQYTTGNQNNPAVAADRVGSFVVSWQSDLQDGSGTAVIARRFTSTGTAIDNETIVHSYTTGSQSAPAVAAEADGDFIVVYQSVGQATGGSDTDIFARRFDVAADAPVLRRPNNQIARQGGYLSFTVTADDQDQPNETLTYSLATGAPTGMTIHSTTGLIEWSPNASHATGDYSVTILVTDSSAGMLTDSITMSVRVFGVDPLGEAVAVHAAALGDQSQATVATDPKTGNYIVAWVGPDGSGTGVFARRFDRSGNALGDTFRVHSVTAGAQRMPVIGIDATGSFVIAWESNQTGNYDIYLRRFNAAGAPVGLEQRVNTGTAGDQLSAALAMTATGSLIVTWQSNGQILGQRYFGGQAILTGGVGEFQISTLGSASGSAVAADELGNFVVVWAGSGIGDGDGIYGRRYGNDGSSGSVFLVNVITAGAQLNPAIAMNEDGVFAVAWETPDADGSGIALRWFAANGSSLGNESFVAESPAGNQVAPSLSMDVDGLLTVVWQSEDSVIGRQYLADGVPLTGEFQIASNASGGSATVAVGVMGEFVVAWGTANIEGVGYGSGIASRRYDAVPLTALDLFVFANDPSYDWVIYDRTTGDGYSTYRVKLTSGIWRSSADVDRYLWEHWMVVYVPDVITSDKALLLIDGGNNSTTPPGTSDIDQYAGPTASATGSVLIDLKQIPNQSVRFTDESFSRTEDAIIAYTWRKFLQTGDSTWPLQLPMTRGAVRAMDAIQDMLHREEWGGFDIESFIVGGASKRGWTTWLTAAVDSRVSEAIPIVIDVLNAEVSFEHHLDVLGFWAPAVNDYVNAGIMDARGTPELDNLFDIVDPYVYRERLTMPKAIINSTGDDFFVTDSWQFYYDDLVGPKVLKYIPNTSHGLSQDAFVYVEALNLYATLIRGSDLPEYSFYQEADGTIVVESSEAIIEARLWRATNPNSRDFRYTTIGPAFTSTVLTAVSPGVYTANVPNPVQGWTAYMIEIVFANSSGLPIRLTTGTYVKGAITNAPPTAIVDGPSNGVRGQPRKFTLAATDPSAASSAQSFSFEVDWNGDGVIDDVFVGPSGLQVEHIFKTSGSYVVQVWATDANNNRSSVSQHAITIVNWELQADPTDPSKVNLVWGGTDGVDAIGFVPGAFFVQALNNQFFPVAQFQSVGQYHKVIAFGQGGSDLLLADVLNVPVELYGGEGDDVLVGGRADDLLVGGGGNDILFGGTQGTDGNDTIFGGDGDDLIIGNYGADLLYGGNGQDLIIAGYLFFESLPSAIYAIQAEWTSGRSYAERVANLTGTGSGARFNADVFLIPGESALADNAVDQVFGEDGQDWILIEEDDLADDVDLASEVLTQLF